MTKESKNRQRGERRERSDSLYQYYSIHAGKQNMNGISECWTLYKRAAKSGGEEEERRIEV